MKVGHLDRVIQFVFYTAIYMKFETSYLDYLRKRTKTYNLGCDYMSISVNTELKLWSNINGLDNNNSSYSFIHGKTYIYSNAFKGNRYNPELTVSISVNGTSYPIMNIYKSNCKGINQNIETVIRIYSSTFRLIEIGELSGLHDILKDYFGEDDYNIILHSRLSRFDYKVDLLFDKKSSIPSYKKLLTGKLGRKSEYKYVNNIEKTDCEELSTKTAKCITKQYKGANEYNGRCFGSGNNKTFIVRCYNKLVEVCDKRKWFLYSDYFNYESARRLEVEFKTKTLKNEKGEPYTLATIEEVEEMAKGYFGFGRQKKKYIYVPNYDVMPIASSYTRQISNMLKKCHYNDMNIYDIVNETAVHQLGLSKDTVKNLIIDSNLKHGLPSLL